MPPVTPSPQPESPRFIDVVFLRCRDQRMVIGVLFIALLAMAGVRLSDFLAGRTMVEYENLPERQVVLRVDINTADETELAGLPVIGPAAAKKIVEYRRAHGPFRTIDDLDNVSGIGPKTVEAIRPYVVIPE